MLCSAPLCLEHICIAIQPTCCLFAYETDTTDTVEYLSHFTSSRLSPLPAPNLYANLFFLPRTDRYAAYCHKRSHRRLIWYLPASKNASRQTSHSFGISLSSPVASGVCASLGISSLQSTGSALQSHSYTHNLAPCYPFDHDPHFADIIMQGSHFAFYNLFLLQRANLYAQSPLLLYSLQTAHHFYNQIGIKLTLLRISFLKLHYTQN